jgi:pimeloyl-ACP methyl ester carboxylesterase
MAGFARSLGWPMRLLCSATATAIGSSTITFVDPQCPGDDPVSGTAGAVPRSEAPGSSSATPATAQVAGHPFRMPYQPVHDSVQAMATAAGFRETLRALEKTRFTHGAAITAPVTVAFGTRDRVLLPGIARHRRQLPDQTRWVRLRGGGHLPWLDDPDAVADLLLRAADPTTAPEVGRPIR